ncbi:MAG TPA: hypothetical protein VN651_14065 [Gemmatimonadaceae bacterium]|jgi:hypothetical protein|nr:hypothetical protein [Gemmatimonadaceae bacterium]
MKAEIRRVEGPEDLEAQAPFTLSLERQLPGPGRPDYWLARLDRPLAVSANGRAIRINWLVLAARFRSQTISPSAGEIAVGVAYVVDEAQLELETVDMSKCLYVAIADAYIRTLE